MPTPTTAEHSSSISTHPPGGLEGGQDLSTSPDVLLLTFQVELKTVQDSDALVWARAMGLRGEPGLVPLDVLPSLDQLGGA